MAASPRTIPDNLEFKDLERFAASVKRPFIEAFGASSVDLVPPAQPDAESGDPLARASAHLSPVLDESNRRLVIPLTQEGRLVCLLSLWGVKDVPALAGHTPPFLPALAQVVIELVKVKIRLETDPVTGFHNEAALEQCLAVSLGTHIPRKGRERPTLEAEQPSTGICLMALKPLSMEHIRESYGRRFGDLVLKQVAALVEDYAADSECLAQESGVFYILSNKGVPWARSLAREIMAAVKTVKLSTPDGGWWQGGLVAGAAAWDARLWRGGAYSSEAAAVLKARSLRALKSAGEERMTDVLFFGEIVDRAGRIKQVMPMGQVLIGLGRAHGLSEGERFRIMQDQKGPGEDSAKAELVVISLGEDESLAEVQAVLDASQPIAARDRLMRLGPESLAADQAAEQVISLAGHQVRVVRDQGTGLPGHASFLAMYRALCAEAEPFAAGLIRLEGLEGMREICGQVGVETLVSGLAEQVAKDLPPKTLIGRFAPDTLGVLMAGGGAAELRDSLETALANAAEFVERPLRAGVAGCPTDGFRPEQVLDNAGKALVHAGFLESGSSISFDEVSLNVSGDALFAQGRIAEAVVEYEKALAMNPVDAFVLNSLGVCFGHLGQMDQAVEYFKRAQDAEPEDFMAYYNLGYAFMSQGKMNQAAGQLEKGLELNPDHGDSLFQLGRLAQSAGRLNSAVEYYRQAARQDDCPSAVHRSLGEALAAGGHNEEAEQAFKQAVKHNSNDAAALSSLAGLYLDRSANLEIALSLAKRARELEPRAARHIRVTARALNALDHAEEAIQLLHKGRKAHPDDPFLAVLLGQVLAGLERAVEARDAFTQALALEPNLESARKGLADLTIIEEEAS